MKKINVLEVNNVDLPGRDFNGYDFISLLDKNKFSIKQAVIEKQSNNENVIEILPTDRLKLMYNKYVKYEKEKSIHNIVSITSPTLMAMKEYQEADIIHLHMFHNTKLSIPSIIDMSTEKKVIITLHDPWLLTGRCVHFFECDKWKTGCKKCPNINTMFPLKEDNCAALWNIKKETFAKANVDIVVSSKWMYDCVKESPIFHTNKNVHLIPFGITSNKESISKDEAKKHFNIPQEEKVLFFRAQKEFKGTEYIVEALKKLDFKGHITLIACDKTGLLNELKDKYNILDLGYISEDEVLKAMTACDMFLMPSKAESFGMMAIKAMSVARPVIIFDNSALPSVTFAPECGYSVKNKDAVALRKAIKTLLEDEAECHKRGEYGKKLVEKYYSSESYIANIEKLYEEVYNRKQKKSPKQLNKNSEKFTEISNELEMLLQENKIESGINNNYNSENIAEINSINQHFYDKYHLDSVKMDRTFIRKLKDYLKKNKLLHKIYKKIYEMKK